MSALISLNIIVRAVYTVFTMSFTIFPVKEAKIQNQVNFILFLLTNTETR